MVKQVIVVRKDLNMPVGKIAAQVAHCSMKVFFDRIEDIQHDSDTLDRHTFCFSANNAEKEWIDGSFTKVVVKCKKS